jgi:hypothetical protein
MAYRLRYVAFIDWEGAGLGVIAPGLTPLQGDVGGNPGGAQSKKFLNAVAVLAAGATTFTQPNGSTISGALASGDITTMLTAMSADLSAQMNANLGTLQAWVAGNP